MSADDDSDQQGERARAPTTSAALFTMAWESLVDMLGSATAATLMRQAASRAALRCPELEDFSVARERLEYRCALPRSWSEPAPAQGLRELFIELRAILLALTGPVVVERLRTIPELAESGLFGNQESAT
ncbi:MAG: hypothetical protein JWO86_7568 [Myxococcaceae bacterium]|nr:hypothetical protein [Myxococcaceae bacterium]